MNVSRRRFCQMLAASAAAWGRVAGAASERPPNIIMLLTDDQRWDTLGVYGNKQLPTPNIDRLGRQGVVFDRGCVTTSICPTSRASFLTGQYGRRHGIVDFGRPLSPDAFKETYPAILRAAGYHTGFIGKYGIGTSVPESEFDFSAAYADQGHYWNKEPDGSVSHITAKNGDQAIEFLKTRPKQRPFCLSLSFKASHQDDDDPYYRYEPQDEAVLAGVTIPKPGSYSMDAFDREFPAFFGKDNLGRIAFMVQFATDELYQRNMRGYLLVIYGVDRVVGRILKELEEQSELANTVIFYSSDNGYYTGEHGLGGKWYGHEPSIRVPLIMANFRAQPLGLRTSALALNIDVAPTILSFAGLPAPARMQGSDLRQLLDPEQALRWRSEFLYEHLFEHPKAFKTEGLVGNRYKYMRYFRGADSFEQVFDLKTDPDERNNLANEPSTAATVAELRERTRRLAHELE
jgi:arylsulfatase A-like enzyme